MELRDYVEIILKRKWTIILVSLCVILGYTIFFFTQSPSYTAHSRLLLRLPPEWQEMPVISMPSWETRVTLLESQPVLERASKRLRDRGYSMSPGAVESGLSVQMKRNTDFVDVYYTSSSAKRSIAVVEELTQAFLKYDRQNNQESLLNAEEALQQEVNRAREALKVEERTLARYRELHQISVKIRDIRSKLDDLRNKYGPKHPTRRNREQTLDQLENRLVKTYKRLFPERDVASQSVNELMVDQSVLSQAQRQVQMATNRLAEIRNSLDQVRFNKSLLGRSSSIVSEPTGTTVSYPTTFRTYGFVILAGLILGISTGSFLEYLDNKIVTKFDVHRYLGLRVLGTIPKVDPDEINLLESPKKTPLSERYHSISALLQYSLLKKKNWKTLLVTSSIKGEGKTTTTLNLAVSLAREGERVLLIDFDLRNPQIHKILNLMNSRGTSSVIGGQLELEHALDTGEDSDSGNLLSWGTLEPIIEESPEPGLEFLPSGPLPSNPIKDIKSSYTDALLEVTREKYGVVILDSPPLTSVVDPVILSTRVDGALMIVKSGQVERGQVQHSKHLLEDVDASILGVVLNQQVHQVPEYYSYYSETRS